MEVSYIIISLVEYNKHAFTVELSELFPLCKIYTISCQGQQLLIVYKDIEALLDVTTAEKEMYDYDAKIEGFSKKHPYLDIAVILVLAENRNCFYEGYILKNKKKIIEHSGMYDAYRPILKHIMPAFDGSDLNIFAQGF